jgi:hypothetical protein
MATHPAKPGDKTISASKRTTILQNLVSLAAVLSSQRLEDFSQRLSDALLNLSEQSVRPAEASQSFNAFNYLRADREKFECAVADRLGVLLSQEVRLLESGGKSELRPDYDMDLSLVTFEEMENKVLLGNIAQALESNISESLNALNLRIGWLVGREQMSAAENPFRAQVFVQAIYEGWCKIDASTDSRRVVLRLLSPDMFLPLDSIIDELNAALIERSILSDLTEAYRRKKSENRFGLPPEKKVVVAKRDEGRYNKVREWLLSAGKKGKGGADGGAGGYGGGGGGGRGGGAAAEEDLAMPDLFAAGTGGDWNTNTISVKVGPRLFGHLTNLQSQLDALEASGHSIEIPRSATTLRKVKDNVPAGSLTQIDENTIELLAKIFDFVFLDQNIPDDMKKLFGQLQIPMLKAALLDKKFFVMEDHPARILMDKLAKSSMAWDQRRGHEDPLYKMISQIVTRVQKEFTEQMDLFSDVTSNLEAFLSEEEKNLQSVLAEPIAEALRQEKMKQARDAAEYDVGLRIDTGEVAGFVEVFLETQWTRILTLAHSVEEEKPDVLVKALKVMDELIWSCKPKTSPEQRKELISKLPSILSLVNAWLNAIKWNEPERVVFFSNLAERHAALVRNQAEMTPRQQVEIAVNIAQKASERRMAKDARKEEEKERDEFVKIVEELDTGTWVNFARNNGDQVRFKLTWISPRRTRFIFTNRQGRDPFSFTAEELAQTLRGGSASVVPLQSVIDRALNAAFEEAA